MRKQRFGWPVRWAGLGRNTQALPYMQSFSQHSQASVNVPHIHTILVLRELIISFSPANTQWLPRASRLLQKDARALVPTCRLNHFATNRSSSCRRSWPSLGHVPSLISATFESWRAAGSRNTQPQPSAGMFAWEDDSTHVSFCRCWVDSVLSFV
jgi:hypothetical protein